MSNLHATMGYFVQQMFCLICCLVRKPYDRYQQPDQPSYIYSRISRMLGVEERREWGWNGRTVKSQYLEILFLDSCVMYSRVHARSLEQLWTFRNNEYYSLCLAVTEPSQSSRLVRWRWAPRSTCWVWLVLRVQQFSSMKIWPGPFWFLLGSRAMQQLSQWTSSV